jgi:hypothetical protein
VVIDLLPSTGNDHHTGFWFDLCSAREIVQLVGGLVRSLFQGTM